MDSHPFPVRCYFSFPIKALSIQQLFSLNCMKALTMSLVPSSPAEDAASMISRSNSIRVVISWSISLTIILSLIPSVLISLILAC